MKKSIAVILCLALALATMLMFTACNETNNNSDGTDNRTDASTDPTTDKPADSVDESDDGKTDPDTDAGDTDGDTAGDADTDGETDPSEEDTQPGTDGETDPIVEDTQPGADSETEPGTTPSDDPTDDTETAGGEPGVGGETEPVSETEPETDPADEYDPARYVVIRTPEDLMQFNADINGEDSDANHNFKTILFLADIDMSGYIWEPLDGFWLEEVTFDGQGHTISNLTIADHIPEIGTDAGDMGAGFIGVNYYPNHFRNITFDTVQITAYERHVGCLMGGNNSSGISTFENVHVKNFTVDGWVDYENQDRDNGGHPIAFRIGGFIGNNMLGLVDFTDCSAENLTFSGFHNLCGFVGYDGSSSMDPSCFTNCSVSNAKFTFSYCMSASYTADQALKYVQVFYCQASWYDNLEDLLDRGNTFSDVLYYDYTDNNHEYLAEEYRSIKDPTLEDA